MLRKALVFVAASILAVSRSVIDTAKALDEAEKKQEEPRQEQEQQSAEQQSMGQAQPKKSIKEWWAEFVQEVCKKKAELAQSRLLKVFLNVAFHIATFFVVDAVCSGIRYLF